ncbi:MAG: NUDIX hydrolase [Bryobacterales bacterium]|nr:NUDIX hydrolase [Bryobacterales bacterium]
MSATPDDRRYPSHPLLGVGALIFDAGRILLIERGREPLKGFWSLPGGLVEAGERLESAVCREVLEETGLVVRPLSLLEIFERIIPDEQGKAEYHYVLIDYVCQVTGGKLCAASDVSNVAWAAPADLVNYRLTAGTLPVIERGFRQCQ